MLNSSNHLPANGKEQTVPLQLSATEDMQAEVEQPTDNGPQLMDVRGVAEYLKLDRQTIYNWLHQQKISGIKVGGVWRFDRRAIDEWLQSRTVIASAQQRKRNMLPPQE